MYKGGGKRNSFRSRGNWPREGIYLPFLFQPFTNNKKWSKVYRKVDYFIYPTGGRLLFQLRDENWFPYTQDLPHKVYLPTPLPSALRFTCCSPVTNKVCCIKGITWLLFNAAPSFESVIPLYQIRGGVDSNPSKILFCAYSSEMRLHSFSTKVFKVVFIPLEWRSSCSIN